MSRRYGPQGAGACGNRSDHRRLLGRNAKSSLASGLKHGRCERLVRSLAGPGHKLERRVVSLRRP
jgi:hypothetical protein